KDVMFGNIMLLGGDYAVKPENFIYASFDLCALILGIVVLINYIVSKKIQGRKTLLFLTLAICTVISAGFDFAAVISLSVTGCPVWFGNLIVALNYLTYNVVGVVFVVYAVSVIYENARIPRWCYAVANVLFVLTIGGVGFATGCLFTYGYAAVPRNLKYAYEGIIYGAQFVSLAFSLTIAIFQRKKLSTARCLNIYFFTLLNMAAVLIQFFVRKVQLSNFALAIAVLLIYVTLQRPEDELDATSGAFNARTFNRRGHMRLDSGNPFLIFAMELSNMTVVNSSFGLNGGNQVIREVADRLIKLLEKGQYLYRLSGVRFAVMFNNQKEYEAFAAKYARVFDKPVSVNETELQITALACVISVPDVTNKLSEVEDLIRYYRTSINVSEEIITADVSAIEKARRRELVDFAIQKAINNRTFEVYYQPIYCVKDGKFSGCEALIRLRDETLGFISPDEFIPIAEQNGKIIEVGRFVIEEVCRFIKDCELQEKGISFVDINLSVIQCMHPEIISDIEQTLEKYQVPRSMVNLEITETASAQSYAMLQTKLNELHSNGFTISLDDFGTGFASVEYLINFPFDVVKLDKALVWAYMSTHRYEPILQHYMPMLHSLGTRIVAEGVETKEMVDALVALGCDYLQGYYYSKPVPKDKFLEFISETDDGEKKLA
ncbi:MAG: EAL domain-containing protein, partial [Clostridia bacterium]|nr:EAL domain-containing protein [Clostridia bacterium]